MIIIIQKGTRDIQKHFKHIFGGGQGWILEKMDPKIRTASLRQILLVLIKNKECISRKQVTSSQMNIFQHDEILI